MGGRVIFFYMLTGQYDLATLIEVPDDETAMRIGLETARLGSVKGAIVRAFTEDETRALMASLS